MKERKSANYKTLRQREPPVGASAETVEDGETGTVGGLERRSLIGTVDVTVMRYLLSKRGTSLSAGETSLSEEQTATRNFISL